MDSSIEKSERYGLIGTIAFHVLLILLFILTGLTYLEPPPPEEGILINFGTDNRGSGNEQAQAAVQNNSPEETEDVDVEQVQSSAQEKVLTQNAEDAPALKTSESENIKEEVKEEPKPSKELSKALSKWKNKSESKSSSDGITGQQGDQGDPSGSMESRNYTGGAGGTGFELIGLGGRSMVKRPDVRDDSQEEGKVVVDIVVDKYGKVVRANPGARGSTTTSALLYKIAKEAALSTKFDTNPQAPEQQKGQIVFTFLLKG
ncbi:MAG: energy transducer TonB [Vicingaceae bacterium]